MTDDDTREEMMKIKGVGLWTANIYLLMALRRPDVWPTGDLALAIAAEKVKRFRNRPTQDALTTISERGDRGGPSRLVLCGITTSVNFPAGSRFLECAAGVGVFLYSRLSVYKA